MTETALAGVVVAALAGLFAGRAWAVARRGAESRPGFRSSPHYTEALHGLATGQTESAIREMAKVLREHPDSVEVQQVLALLYREVGQVERAIDMHRGLLARPDVTRTERAHALASLGTDYRKAGLLDRAAAAYGEALDVDPRNVHALAGQQGAAFVEDRLGAGGLVGRALLKRAQFAHAFEHALAPLVEAFAGGGDEAGVGLHGAVRKSA